MNKSLALKNKLYLFFLLTVSLFLFLYMFYFLINGERGIISYFKIKNQNSNYKIIMTDLNNKNDLFKSRITMLQPNSLDLDYLDEKIRQKIGFIDENELLIKF